MNQADERSMINQFREESIAIVVLAAGAARRMNAPKQLLSYEGRSLLRRTVEAALGSVCHSVLVVVGARAAEVQAELNGLAVQIVENAEWAAGMSTSIRVGVAALTASGDQYAAAIISVCDQPHLSAQIFDELVAVHQTTGKPIVASRYNETLGPPTLFAREFFGALCALQGDAGAKQVMRQHAEQTATVKFDQGSIDIDTPADYEKLVPSG